MQCRNNNKIAVYSYCLGANDKRSIFQFHESTTFSIENDHFVCAILGILFFFCTKYYVLIAITVFYDTVFAFHTNYYCKNYPKAVGQV